MNITLLFSLLIIAAVISHFVTKRKIQNLYLQKAKRKGKSDLKTQPHYFGYVVAMWFILPAVLIYYLLNFIESSLSSDYFSNNTALKSLLIISFSFAIGLWKTVKIKDSYPARIRFEKAIEVILLLSSGIAILTTLGIVLSVLFESFKFFGDIPIWDFMFGLDWSP